MTLPDGLSSRPLARSDSRAVFAVMAAQELADVGEVVVDEADIVADWQRPSFDVGECSVGVFASEQLVAYAEVSSAIAVTLRSCRDFAAAGSAAGWPDGCRRRHAIEGPK